MIKEEYSMKNKTLEKLFGNIGMCIGFVLVLPLIIFITIMLTISKEKNIE